VERPAVSLEVLTRLLLGSDGVRGYRPTSQRRDAPNFLHATLDETACAPFFKERRMEFAEPTKLHRKSGTWGTLRWFPVLFFGPGTCHVPLKSAPNDEPWVPHTPDFLWVSGLGAHAALSGDACRKSGYLARFSRDVGYHGPNSPLCREAPESALPITKTISGFFADRNATKWVKSAFNRHGPKSASSAVSDRLTAHTALTAHEIAHTLWA
jgi:hypothetical protein